MDGKRCAAIEILLGTSTIKDLILRGDIDGIKEIMEKSEALGMQTFDSALFKLVVEGRISEEEALKNADSANNLRLRLKLRNEVPSEAESSGGFSLEDIVEEEETEEEEDSGIAHRL